MSHYNTGEQKITTSLYLIIVITHLINVAMYAVSYFKCNKKRIYDNYRCCFAVGSNYMQLAVEI